MTALQSFPVRTEIENLTEDLVSGPRNTFALRGANIPGSDTIRVGTCGCGLKEPRGTRSADSAMSTVLISTRT
ncbi:MAG: hypothetical protein R2839_04670 [Thermomicrobiales bacterium]